jgi:antitoxin MazE
MNYALSETLVETTKCYVSTLFSGDVYWTWVKIFKYFVTIPAVGCIYAIILSPQQVKMANQKLTLEIPELLLEELQHLAELTGQSVEYFALQSITNSLPPIARKYSEKIYDLDELLSRVTTDNLHGEINSGELVGREIF